MGKSALRKLSAAAALSLATAALLVACSAPAPTTTNGHARVYSATAGQTLTLPSTATPKAIVSGFLRSVGLRLAANQLQLVRENYRARSGLTHLRFEQEVDGLRVMGGYVKATLTDRGELTHVIEHLAPTIGRMIKPAAIGAGRALTAALQHHGYLTTKLGQLAKNGNVTHFARNQELYAAPTVERIAYQNASGRLVGGFLVETWSQKGNLLHHTLIDDSGRVVKVELRTNTDSYNVFTIDPVRTPQAVIAGPGGGNAESPVGWLDSGDQLDTNISGNNVNAYLDTDGNDRPDRGGNTVSGGNFLTAANLSDQPSTATNQAVAVQNLFYLNNVIHDVLYRHGFDEAAGNFQNDNFGNGGTGRDAVKAEAQDGSGTDNANFSTPRDGRSGRMQMFLWHGDGASFQVAVNSPTATAYDAGGAEFGPSLDATGVTGDVVLADDGTGNSDGCSSVGSAVSGKIALIDRGTCPFVDKVLNAQTAGATGVIIANNAGDDYITMGGDSRRIRIPSLFIGQSDGAALRAMANPNATLRTDPPPPPFKDSTVDSDIVFHEYGHGLTWRMIGGMSGHFAGAIGEGAGDTVAFLNNGTTGAGGDSVIGEYSFSNPNGIRSAPYRGYSLTYSDATVGEVHYDGEIYAAAMWELLELFEADPSTDRDTLFTLFVDGMNYTPSTPAFEDMRDGMLASDTALYGGAHKCLIWTAFANRGIGEGASGTVSNSGAVTIVESFTIPAGVCAP